FAKQVAAFLKGSGIKLAVVANFPHGGSELPPVLQEIEHSLEAGAQEIDLVFPYQAFLAGEHAPSLNFVKQCKAAAGLTTLKVILETSALSDLNLIAEATQMVVMAGADFVKTSTGKLPQGATLEAAAVILLTLKKLIPNFNRTLGFKAAGGIQDPQQAAQYLSLAKNIMGLTWPTPQTFRLGASQLLAKLTVV
ncbi:MAG TPA: deoxyribose-phosphate aldolase, partial [Gammaproteobacteria bacterium]|nr:deoxyribose-phosphate aldolase [Gammaproteobacteria bacterium]